VNALTSPPPLQPLNRAQRQQLRRGELHADLVSAWMDRTRGLAAPTPPPEGELGPNGCGWLLGLGSPSFRLYPRFWQWARALTGGLPAMGPAVAGSMGLQGLAAVAAVSFAPVLALWFGVDLWTWVRLARHWRRARPVARLDDVAPGTLVRVGGVIAEQPTVSSLFRGIPAVLFRNRIGGADETRGIDFALDLPDGQRAQIRARNAALIDRPRPTTEPPACGPVAQELWGRAGQARLRSTWMSAPRPLLVRRRESSVGPGDRVEVCGVVDHEAAPDRASTFDRHIPVAVVVRSAAATPLFVRSAPWAPWTH
jgi:hypothetical protein